jgi:hypothetical protein
VLAGNLFFSIQSREFGRLETVYPPALYIVMTPLAQRVRDLIPLLKIFPLALQSLNGLTIFYLAHRNSLSERAAVSAAFFYLMLPIAFLPFSWAIYANVFAQEVFLLTLTLWFVLPWHTHPRSSALLLSFLFFVNLLAHPSALPLLVIFWGIFLVALWLFKQEARLQIIYTASAFGVAVIAAFVLYFSFFSEKSLADVAVILSRQNTTTTDFNRTVGAAIIDQSLGLVPASAHSIGEWLQLGILYFLRETWAYYRGVVMVAALFGLYVIWRRREMRALALAVGAGLSVVIVFAIIGFAMNLYTRYMLFGLPFVALAAGVALDRWLAAHSGVRGLTIVGIVVLLQQILWMWFGRVVS